MVLNIIAGVKAMQVNSYATMYQMCQIDSTTMSQDEYYKMLIDIVNRQVPPTTTIQSLFYTYA